MNAQSTNLRTTGSPIPEDHHHRPAPVRRPLTEQPR